MERYIPFVIDKTLKKTTFNPVLIHKSLLEETSISKVNSKLVTEKVVRMLINLSNHIKIITAPMIREIVNVVLLEHGLEIERLQYTRIGFPLHDLTHLFSKENILLESMAIDMILASHVRIEYQNVLNVIKKLRENNVT
jgi:anaerobic ribonucleoside-triphosphate reductase